MPSFVLTDAMIQRLRAPEGAQRADYRDAKTSGLVLRVGERGRKSWSVVYRVKGTAERVRETLGDYPAIGLAEARLEATKARLEARKGINRKKATLEAEQLRRRSDDRRVHLQWENIVRQYVERRLRLEKGNRSADESERCLNVYVTPSWGGRLISDITRADVNALLDRIYDGTLKAADGRKLGGPVQADRVLANIRALMNWWATRDETYASPIVRGMARTRPGERARDRILSDAEVAALWRATATLDTFGSLVRMLLLTAQRRSEVAHMRRSEIRESIWTVPAERYKTNRATVVPLPPLALEIVQAQPVISGCDFVFTRDGRRPFGDFSDAKKKLDCAMIHELGRLSADPREPTTLPHWQLHDLRRTSRSLMSRGGVRPDIAERVLGHVISGVAGVYDRHSYEHEKAEALRVLSLQISKIVDPPGSAEVIALRRGPRQAAMRGNPVSSHE